MLYITCNDKKEAIKIGKTLVTEKLIACANYFPIKSIYLWNGKISTGNEYTLLIKTIETRYKSVVGRIKTLHSFDIPCILKFDVKANKKYDNWANTVMI